MVRHEAGLFWRRYRRSISSRPASLAYGNSLEKDEGNGRSENNKTSDQSTSSHVSLRERVKHFTWAWFTLPMSTGGIALLLASQPHTFPGLRTIGKVVFLFDLVIFLLLCILISIRFILTPGTLQRSLKHPTEGLFFATFFLGLVNGFNCIQEYGVPSCGDWLLVVMRVLFWVYVAMTFGLAVGQMVYLITAPARLTIQSMTPAWLLPVFPVMLTGTFASLVAPTQPPGIREPIIVAGVTFQGLGWMVSFMMYAIYIHRLMQFGLPAPNLRPGMFIAVGPPSFTGLALIGLSQSLSPETAYLQARPGMIMVLQTLAEWSAIFLWCLSFWFFCITVICNLASVKEMSFHLVWWAFVFPNVGFTIATKKIGERLGSEGILWVASVMSILLVAMWLFVFGMHARAVWRREIMMPGLDEDKDEYKEDDRKHDIPVPPEKHGHQRVTQAREVMLG